MLDYTDFLYNLKLKERLREIPLPHCEAIIDFTHNDYLCMGSRLSKMLLDGELEIDFLFGAKASRLIKNHKIFDELEFAIAKKYGTQEAILFPSGYQANVGILGSLLDKNILGSVPLVFCDKLIHASMHMGLKIAGIKQIRFGHNDLLHLEKLLLSYSDFNNPKIIIVESVYSMDGTVADIDSLNLLARKFGASLYIDEAHAIGLYGSKLLGLSDSIDNTNNLIMGTLSKSLGLQGGYLACSSEIKKVLVNTSGGQIYSTALSPFIAQLSLAAFMILDTMRFDVIDLKNRAKVFNEKLTKLGYRIFNHVESNIIAVDMVSEANVLRAKNYLFDKGFCVGAIRPPTVPKGTSRLRICLNTSHTTENIENLCLVLDDFKRCYYDV